MTTKIISGTYSAGYALSASYDAVTITASGSVGGSGLVTTAFASVTNFGHLEAGLGANGVTLGSSGGDLFNWGAGYIRGGAARAASGAGAAGNAGGAGAFLTVYSAITDNLGDVVGGAGGAGVAGTYGGAGGAGGAGAWFHGGGQVTNQGLIRGGTGGSGGAGSATHSTSGGLGGAGGTGVGVIGASGRVISYSAHIYGGAGGLAGGGAGHGNMGGAGGAGIYLTQGGYVDVYHGLVQGGAGGYGGASGGNGGAGLIATGPAVTVVNSGMIVGGAGAEGGGKSAMGQYGAGSGGGGGSGVQLNKDVRLVNNGTIEGGDGGNAVTGGGVLGGPGSYGAFCTNYCTILNYGTIISGAGGAGAINGHPKGGVFMYGGMITNGSQTDTSAFIGINTTGATGAKYGDGVFVGYTGLSPATVTNFGTIEGGSYPEAFAVFFHPGGPGSNGPTLVVEAGCAFIGKVFGGEQGVLALASGTGTLTVLDSSLFDNSAIVSGSMATTTFTAFATLEIDAGASFTLAAGSDVSISNGFADDTLEIAGTATIAATLSVEGTIDVSGKLAGARNSSLVIDGGTANFFNGASLFAPTVDVSDGAQVYFENRLDFAHTWDQTSGTLSVSKGSPLTFSGSGSTFSGLLTGSGGVGLIAFAPAVPGTDTLNEVTISDLIAKVSDASLTVGPDGAIIASSATVLFYGASADGFTGASTLSNAGLIETTNTAGTSITDAIINTGVLYADGGNLTVEGAVTGTGTAKITAATLDFTSAFTGNVTFAGGSGELVLAQSRNYKGSISGFSTTGGTTLDLRDIGFVNSAEATFSGTATGGVLTVTDGTHTARIKLRGDFLSSTFTASSDGGGGVLITDPSGGGGAAPPPHTFIAAMAGMGAVPGAGMSMQTMTGPSDVAAALLTPRATIA